MAPEFNLSLLFADTFGFLQIYESMCRKEINLSKTLGKLSSKRSLVYTGYTPPRRQP